MNENGRTTKKNKTIKILERKSAADDIDASLQLAEYYEDGQFVKKSPLTAVKYERKVVELFRSQSLRISSLTLVNFRAFENSKIYLCNEYENDSNLTVFLGNNGSGKTTILESIAKSLSWLIRRITSPSSSGTGDKIEIQDINNKESVEYSSIITKLQTTKINIYDIELSKTKPGRASSRTNHLYNIGQLGMLTAEHFRLNLANIYFHKKR